jgi:dipeptidyl-peptidase-4
MRALIARLVPCFAQCFARSLARCLVLSLVAWPAASIAQAANTAAPSPASTPAPTPGMLTLERLVASPALSGPGVRQVKIAPDGSRVTWLKARPDDRYQLDLWQYHIASKSMSMLVDSKVLQPKEELSMEQQARRERERSAGLRGILDYSWSPDGQQILLPLADALYRIEVAKPGQVHKLVQGEVLDAKISPRGRYVSYVRGQKLFVIDLQAPVPAGGPVPRQLTQDGGGTIHNAEAEFVAQEEMDQSSGYWWAPDDSAIAFKRFDEAPVAIAKRYEIHPQRTEIVEQRYPFAGQANVTVSLGLVSPNGGPVRLIEPGLDPDIYLARLNWHPNGREFWYQRQSRDHKRLDLVAVQCDTLAQRTILSETSRTWINLHDDLRFVQHGARFIWGSERSGNHHLYLYQSDGTLLHPISSGEWRIDQILALDEAGGQLWVGSNRDAATDKQVYRLPLSGQGQASRVTRADGWHEAVFAKQGKFFVDNFSNPTTPAQVAIRDDKDQVLAWLEKNELNASHPYAPYLARHVVPEFGTLRAEDGQTLHYYLFKPPGFDPQRRYPVLINVYGGPGVQMVRRRWQGGGLDEYLAQHGYLVFQLDNRGSARRSRQFTDVIYHNMGQHEVDDQLRGLDWLRSQSFVDAKRIAVFGGSYGGFMTLRMLAAASDQIAAGIAHAAPVDWHSYDTYYTEHYLGHPKTGPEAYRISGVLPYLKGVRSPLLVTHGMADDNVLFSNATSLMQALNEQGTLYELMTYPGERHGIRSPGNQLHWYRTIESFLARRMGGQ